MGLFWKWLIAAPISLGLALYSTFMWSAATPIEWDRQDRMDHPASELILAVLVGGGAVAFATGFGVFVAQSRDGRNKAREVHK